MPIAFVVGHTGKAGRALCKKLGKDKVFEKVVLIGRKDIDTTQFGDCFECRKVDFDNLEPDMFKGFDQGFCAIGTRPGDFSRDYFFKYSHILTSFMKF